MPERERWWDAALADTMLMRAKLERGEELTPEELERFQEIFQQIAAVLKPMTDALIDAFNKVADAITLWYAELPEETKNALDVAVFEQDVARRSAADPINIELTSDWKPEPMSWLADREGRWLS